MTNGLSFRWDTDDKPGDVTTLTTTNCPTTTVSGHTSSVAFADDSSQTIADLSGVSSADLNQVQYAVGICCWADGIAGIAFTGAANWCTNGATAGCTAAQIGSGATSFSTDAQFTAFCDQAFTDAMAPATSGSGSGQVEEEKLLQDGGRGTNNQT